MLSRFPMTNPQRSYLMSLTADRDYAGRLDASQVRLLRGWQDNTLDKTGATRLIDALKRCPLKQAAPRNEDAMRAEVGYYMLGDDIIHVSTSRSYPNRHIAKVLVLSDVHTDKGVHRRGSWQWPKGLVWRLGPEHRLSEEQARSLSRQYGVCIVCGKTLINPAQVAEGIGKKCAEKQAAAFKVAV